jgi:hypothetical protein
MENVLAHHALYGPAQKVDYSLREWCGQGRGKGASLLNKFAPNVKKLVRQMALLLPNWFVPSNRNPFRTISVNELGDLRTLDPLGFLGRVAKAAAAHPACGASRQTAEEYLLTVVQRLWPQCEHFALVYAGRLPRV